MHRHSPDGSRALAGLLLALCALSACAQGSTTPTETVERFHQALEQGQADEALRLLDPALVVFESGHAEYGLAEYRGHHLPHDLAFARQVQRQTTRSQEQQAGDWAWVMSQAVVSGQVGEKTINQQQMETMVLRRGADGWKILHIHWSARARKAAP